MFGLLVVSSLMLILPAAGCVPGMNDKIRESGTVETENRTISSFSAVTIMSIGQLLISQGSSEALTVEAEDNLLPLFRTEVRNGTLVIDTQPNTSFQTTKPIIYRLAGKPSDKWSWIAPATSRLPACLLKTSRSCSREAEGSKSATSELPA
jgi:hypothetical protein